MESSKWNGVEVRTLPVIGTLYVEYTIWLDGQRVYSQLSPYSDAEIAERVARFKRHIPSPAIKANNWRSKGNPEQKPAGYVWRTGVDEQ